VLLASLSHGGGRAYYSPSADRIQMPEFGTFTSPAAYYSTLAHEHVHWTGHPSRLEREQSSPFGSPGYAFEELVAELGSAYLCDILELDGVFQHPEYIGHWIKKLEADPDAFHRASGLATKAVRWMQAKQDAE